jgi:hypothetical protein
MDDFIPKLSIYIPSVPGKLADDIGIRHYMQSFGHIESINIIPIKGSNNAFQAFVHYNEWYNDDYSRNWQRTIMDESKTAKLSNGWDENSGYFILLPSTAKSKQNSNL